MFSRRILKISAGIALVAGVVTGAAFTRDSWLPWLSPANPADGSKADSPVKSSGESQQVKLTPQAQSNLRLISKPLKVAPFWRTIQVPGMIVDRPAYSDRGIVSPVTGVVTKVDTESGLVTVELRATCGDDKVLGRAMAQRCRRTYSSAWTTSWA